jgi:chromosome partitioning protein
MKVITFLQEKGGVGKTTSSTIVAADLSRRGYKVLLIDGDSQGHATLALNLKRSDGMYAFMVDGEAPNNILKAVNPELYGLGEKDYNLWVITGGGKTRLIPDMMQQKDSGVAVTTLKKRLEQLATAFDFVVIDTSPSISNLHIAYYVASDWIIAPTECTYLPMEGLFTSIDHLKSMHEQLSPKGIKVASLLGILPTKFYGREIVQYENLGYLKGRYEGLVLPYMRRLSDWEKAAQVGEILFTFAPNGDAMKDAKRVVDDILKRLEAEEKANVIS